MSLTINNRYRVQPIYPMWGYDRDANAHEKRDRRTRPRRILQSEPACTVRRFPFLMMRDEHTLDGPGGYRKGCPVHSENTFEGGGARRVDNTAPTLFKNNHGGSYHESSGDKSRVSRGAMGDNGLDETQFNMPGRNVLVEKSKVSGPVPLQTPAPIKAPGETLEPSGVGMNIDIWL